MKLIHALELPLMLIAIFLSTWQQIFDTRLSSVLYLVGFQFAKQVGESILSPIAGVMYDSLGFRYSYMLMGGIGFYALPSFQSLLYWGIKKTKKGLQEASEKFTTGSGYIGK
ncbi:hypothetical protein GCM10020331_046740 [Ectobacillus funiculus]